MDKTLQSIKNADPKNLYDCIMSYCSATGCELPRNVETRIMLALKIVDEGLPEDADLSIIELQEIADFIERAQALKERQERLIAFRKFIDKTVGEIDIGDLAFRGKELLAHFSPDLVLVSSFSPDTLDRRCAAFIEDFRIEYANYHNAWFAKRIEIGDRFEAGWHKIEMLKKLNTVERLGPEVGVEIIEEFSKFPRKIPLCKAIKVSDLGFSTECPHCGLQFKAGLDWASFIKLEKRLDEACRRKLNVISMQVSKIAVKTHPDDPLRAFIDAVAVSDLEKLYNVLEDEVLDSLKKILESN
ncbi:MAG TPA: hypothetical protein ENN07_07675 [candidate division Zixibacteria bacterium]|nr:hypothetical protein [candidate division Zixibacteria bacterium]